MEFLSQPKGVPVPAKRAVLTSPKGDEFFVHCITPNHEKWGAFNQFRVPKEDFGPDGTRVRGEPWIPPSVAKFVVCHEETLVGDFIVKMKLGSDTLDSETEMTVVWMNGKWLNGGKGISATDSRFVITKQFVYQPAAGVPTIVN